MSAPSNSPASSNGGPSKFAWLHFRCAIPSDWEPVAFSTSQKEGRVEFANRHGHQARVSWLKCKSPPDLRRIMDEFQRGRLKTSSKEEFKSFSSLSFREAGQFVIGVHRNSEPCQAAYYQPEIKTMTIWTFPDFSEERFSSLWIPVLLSFSDNLSGWRDWAAWGLDFRLPEAMEPIEVHPMPANVTMSFEGKPKLRIDCHRWGLPQLILQGRPLEDFYGRFLRTGGCKVTKVSPCKINGFDAVEADFEQRGFFDMEKLYGRWWNGKGVCWFDRVSQRICAGEQSGAAKKPKLDFKDVFPILK